MDKRDWWPRGWRGIVLLVVGGVMAANLVTPAVAHIGTSLSHLYKHLDKRYLNNNEVLVRSQADPTGFQTHPADGLVELNSVSINAPSDGLLVISGQAYLNNNSGGSLFLCMVPRMDGTPVGSSDFSNAAALVQSANSTDTDEWTLSYTVTAPVTKGAHTVSQDGGPCSGTASWDHGLNELTVLFVQAGSVLTPAREAGTGASPRGPDVSN